MPLDGASPNLDALLIATVLELELSDRDNRVADKRYQFIPEHLQRPHSPVRHLMDGARVYAQGSRAIGATIVDGASEDDRFDLDAVLELPRPMDWTGATVLDRLFDAFQGFPDARNVERCTRCIQIQFAFMHLDITPMDPAPEPRLERVGQIYHSPDEGGVQYFDVNPFGFADWFQGTVAMPSRQFVEHVRLTRESVGVRDRFATVFADADIDDLPTSTNPLRDAPQVLALKLLKRYRNLRYADRAQKRPISVYLSKVAAQVPLAQAGLCAQLEALAAELIRRIDEALLTRERPDERNPAFPKESFNDRWPSDVTDLTVFRGDLEHLTKELARARRSEFSEIRKIFDALFGETVGERAAKAYAASVAGRTGDRPSYQPGRGFVAAPALVAPSGSAMSRTSRAPGHHFHPGRRG